MKKIFLLTALAVLLGMATASAQQIAVVAEDGETTVYQTLPQAIDGAEPGSVIYLPGGGFDMSDDVKITKKLTIIGIGHRSDNDNVDGNTKIIGNLWFNGGSSSSAILGCYITGDVIIGEDDVVNNVLVKFNDLNAIQVKNAECSGTFINQNYIRSSSWFSMSSANIYNNMMGAIMDIKNAYIQYNIIGYAWYGGNNGSNYNLANVQSSFITNNVLRGKVSSGNYYGFYDPFSGSNCTTSSNAVIEDHYGKQFGDNPIVFGVSAGEIFVNPNGWSVSPNSNFHFKEEYKQYENVLGIYAGNGFNEHQTAPVPYIVAKRIDQETDAAGQLKIQVRVKAGE